MKQNLNVKKVIKSVSFKSLSVIYKTQSLSFELGVAILDCHFPMAFGRSSCKMRDDYKSSRHLKDSLLTC